MGKLKNTIAKVRKNIMQRNVIRKKLLLYFLISAILVNSICLYTYNNTRLLINKINQIFINDISLTNLGASVEAVESSLKEYLTTSHSEDLEDYLNNSHLLRNKAAELDAHLSNDESELLLVDIKGMIGTYLEYAEAAETSKRGRDINGYSASFNEASKIYDYIYSYINKLKIYQFQENNRNYLQLDSRLGLLQVFNMFVILIAMVVNIVLIFWFSYSLTEPIIKLSKAAGEIADGNYDIPGVSVGTNDELKSLAVAFNRMKDGIRRQLVEIRQKAEIESRLQDQEMQNLKMRSMLNEAQLKALQAQINPHFMFNTLNAGMQLAMFEGADRTQAFMEKLSESLRYNLGKIGISATLSMEITNIDNYIYLLTERFGDRIKYVKMIEDVPDVPMPRMILQPIVENSFIHGINEREDGGVISLSAWCERDTVRVEIADNGTGMDAETIEKILSEDYQNSPIELEERPKSSYSIGLRNVIGRLMLYYKASSVRQVIDLESNPGAGTRVSLKLPLKKPEVS